MPVTASAAMRARRLAGLVLLLSLGSACEPRVEYEVNAVAGGNAHRGEAMIREYGCGTCHSIPGVPGANSLVGPPLKGLAARAYIGGVLSNTPDNLISWIRDPQAASPRTAMPDLGVTERDARDIAAYIYQVR